MSEEESPPKIPQVEPEIRDQEVKTASAILSLSGPCRGVGDIYLACVATAGLGQCRHLRANFEACAKQTMEGSKQYLETIGQQVCPNEEDKAFCAALVVNQQLMMQAYPPSTNQE